jgi:hypothetical protein
MTPRDKPTTGERSGFAGQSELSEADQAIVEAMEKDSGLEEEDRVPGTLSDDEAIYQDVSAVPASERTASDGTSGYEETEDGLSDLEEAVRQQAEDRALGDDQDFKP